MGIKLYDHREGRHTQKNRAIAGTREQILFIIHYFQTLAMKSLNSIIKNNLTVQQIKKNETFKKFKFLIPSILHDIFAREQFKTREIYI